MSKKRKSGITPFTVFLGILVVLAAAGFMALKITAKEQTLMPAQTSAEVSSSETEEASDTAEKAGTEVKNDSDGFSLKIREATPAVTVTKDTSSDKTEDSKTDDSKTEDAKTEETKTEDTKKEETESDDSDSKSSSYLCKSMSSKKLTAKKLKSLKKSIKSSDCPGGRSVVQMLINELYARNGYHFDSKDLQKYFKNKSWYKDKGRSRSEAVSKMNKTEKYNLDFLTDNR